jgi:hypothetical protein
MSGPPAATTAPVAPVILSSGPSRSEEGDANARAGTGAATVALTDEEDEASVYGTGPYHNIRRGIEMRHISDDFQGLFALEPLAAGTVLWKNRADGPAEVSYRKIYGSDLRTLSPAELRYFIRYSYQNDDDFFISPLCAEEVDRDLSNYWNHSVYTFE